MKKLTILILSITLYCFADYYDIAADRATIKYRGMGGAALSNPKGLSGARMNPAGLGQSFSQGDTIRAEISYENQASLTNLSTSKSN
jgi:hypothetical protein